MDTAKAASVETATTVFTPGVGLAILLGAHSTSLSIGPDLNPCTLYLLKGLTASLLISGGPFVEPAKPSTQKASTAPAPTPFESEKTDLIHSSGLAFISSSNDQMETSKKEFHSALAFVLFSTFELEDETDPAQESTYLFTGKPKDRTLSQAETVQL